jgi:hypothetical protein
VTSIRELMERIADRRTRTKLAALIEEYVEGRELYVGVIGTTTGAPLIELDLSKLPEGTRDCRRKSRQGHRRPATPSPPSPRPARGDREPAPDHRPGH